MRWSVFLLGPAGCGKSAIWKTLLKAQNECGEKTIYRPINPKVHSAFFITLAICLRLPTNTGHNVYLFRCLDMHSISYTTI